MFAIIIGGFSTAIFLGIGAFAIQKMKDGNVTDSSKNKYKKHVKQVDVLFEEITTMNPFQKDKTIFEKGQELIFLSLRIRDNSSNNWYSDNNVLQLLLDYDNLYKELLKKYNHDAHLEQIVFESLVRPYQAFWINLGNKTSSDERIKYMKDMFVIFNEIRPEIESELQLLIEDSEVKENLIVHNERIQSQEVVNQVFKDSLAHIRDKKRYSVAKTIHDTNEQLGGTADEKSVNKSEDVNKPQKKLTIDDL